MLDSHVRPRHWSGIVCLLALAASVSAQADDAFVPYGRIRYDYNSNIFALPDASEALTAFQPNYPTRIGDHVTTYFVGADSTLPIDRQELIFNGEYRKLKFSRLSDLDHNEYTFSGDFKWTLADWSSGDVRYHEVKQMAPFVDRQATTLAIQTERIAEATARFALSADWSLTPRLNVRNLHAPELDRPDFTLHEEIGALNFIYAGLGPTRVGIEIEKLSDSYHGVVGVPDISQTSIVSTLDYKVTGLTTLDATLGITKRTQGVLAGAKTAWTGSLAYRRQLTAKTSVNAQVTRAFNSYVFAGGSELDTTGAVGMTWDATRKLSVTAGYQHTKSEFVGYVLPGAGIPGRLDKVDSGLLTVTYVPVRWLTIQPHFTRQRRDSNQVQLTYNDTIVGVDFTVKRTYP